MDQHEIVDPSPLLDDDGSLLQRGWARQPLLDCNLEQARCYRFASPLQHFRIKRWDYYGVTYPGGYFSATLADLGYAGQAFAYMVDLESATYVEDTITIPLGRGVTLPRNSNTGTASWQGKRATLDFQTDGDRRIVSIAWDRLGGRPLRADLSFDSATESTVTATPIGERRFYYNRKINCMPAQGAITFGDRTVNVEPATSSGTLDWGRGIWEYRSFWVWASASGFLSDGRRIGLNMGFGFGDTSAATENTLTVAGRIHKLADIDFDYDSSDYKHAWTMRSDRVDITFVPAVERTALTNLLLVRSEVHQMFGHYSGTVIDDAGNRHRIERVVGWAEEHHARW